MRPLWRRVVAIWLLLFAATVLTATLAFLAGGVPAADGNIPAPRNRPDDARATVKVLRLEPATHEVEILITIRAIPTWDKYVLSVLFERQWIHADISAENVTGRELSWRGMVTAQAQPQQFPDDSYIVDLTLVLERPSRAPEDRIPVSVEVEPNSHLADWRMTASLDEAYACSVCGAAPGATLTFERPVHVRLFVYGVAVAPLLLGLSAGLHWVRDRRSRAAPIELAAALLALLPLRDVLVPDDIPGITRLDHVLGAEVVLIAVAVAGVTAVRLWRSE